ncbi:hypothetical protein [Pseudomonas capeferrum]
MEYLQRLLDKIDRFELLIAGLVGAVIASWWHKDDLNDWRAWMIFLITGMACSIYLTSMVSTYLGVTEPKIVAGISRFCWAPWMARPLHATSGHCVLTCRRRTPAG